MKKINTIVNLTKNGLVAVVRSENQQIGYEVINKIIEGGFNIIEITYTTPNADKLIYQLNQKYIDNKDVIIGAGTVLDSETARISIINGAKFIVSPNFNKEVAKLCNSYQVLYLPGCLTPREVYEASLYGCDIIKLFPSSMVSPKLIKELNGPFPNLKFMPSGGVNLSNMKEWIDNNAIALSVGSYLTKDLKVLGLNSVYENASKFVNEFKKIKPNY